MSKIEQALEALRDGAGRGIEDEFEHTLEEAPFDDESKHDNEGR